MSALPPKADIRARQADVRFLPIAGIGKTSGATKRMGPSPVLVLRAAERNQNANYEVQAYERSKFASYCLEESKRRPGKPEPPIKAVRINAPLGAGELEARAMMLAREVDRRREQLLTKTMAAMLR
jgi:hypothetical protein